MINLLERTRYYQALIDTELLMAGADYAHLRKTIIIFICPFPVLDGTRHMYTFRNVCLEDRSIVMPDDATKIFLSTKGTLDDVAPDIRSLLEYVDGIHSEDDFVLEIDREINRLKAEESERVSYMTYAMKIQEEREEGRREGRREGHREGRKAANESVAMGMLRDNFPAETIAKYTSLSTERIAELAATL